MSLAHWSDRLAGLDDVGPGARVVVACSGGADSLALLALARDLEFEVTAVYVDHGLRATTAHDRAVVARAADQVGATFATYDVHVGEGPNLEARARAVRYDALERARVTAGAAVVLVGHTRDDQAETVLLNLLRGSGIAGLAGMAPARGCIRRPLLSLRRADTLEICARLGWAPVHDTMNDEMRFRRVWLRREIVPRLERGAARDLVEVLARQADLVRDEDAFLSARAAEFDIADVAALDVAIARRVVRSWLGAPPPSSAVVERVLAVARGERLATELPGGDRVARVGGRVVRVVAPPASDIAPVALTLPGSARFGDVEIAAWIEHGPPVAWPDGRNLAVCDADRVPETVVVRSPAAGERFQPLGLRGRTLVRDALAAAGVPAGSRGAAPVVAASEPVWVVGYRIAHEVRVTSRTRRFLWLSAESAAP